jgi:hypothetical protein
MRDRPLFVARIGRSEIRDRLTAWYATAEILSPAEHSSSPQLWQIEPRTSRVEEFAAEPGVNAENMLRA